MPNLLQKASIVLTPTAYDDGKVLCAKPSEPPYGDFDFSRNSAATRVNAQGLVENVQILSGNLVQNGDFSEEGVQEVSNGSFSQEGVELITNGNFDTDSDWVKGTGWSISGGSANCDGNTTDTIRQNIGLIEDDFYKVTFEVSNISQGGISVVLGGTIGTLSITENGSYTLYSKSGVNPVLYFQPVSNFQGSIDNVSVREVGQDWTLGTGWSIGEDKAVADGSDPAVSGWLRQNNILTAGKTYTFSCSVETSDSGLVGSVNDFYGKFLDIDNGSGEYTATFTAVGTGFAIAQRAGKSFSITNISVKEVGQNWDLGDGWSIAENKAVSDGTINKDIYQVSVTTSGKTYKYSFDVLDVASGVLDARFRNGSGGVVVNFSSEGTYTGTFVAYGSRASFVTLSGNTASYSITNISVIEITDETNLPRINYEGFSYQDALGSELVTNGSFDDGSTGWALQSGWSIENGIAESDGVSGSISSDLISYSIGKIYEISLDIISYTSGILYLGNGSIFPLTNLGVSQGGETITLRIESTRNGKISLFSLNFIGSIDNVSVKEYLGQEVVPDSGCGSWLFEPQSTNLITYSEDFSDSSWSKNAISATSGFTSPSGDNSAFKISGTGGSSYHNIRTSISTTNSTVSCFVKKGTLNHFEFIDTIGGSPYSVVQYNLEEVTANINVAGVFLNPKIEDYGNGWYRCSAEATATASIHFNISKGSTDGTGLIEANDYLYIWGAQLEQQTYATSYIPTSGTSVTRNQDVCTNGGSLASINSTEGVLYAEIAKNSLSNNNQISISLNSGSTNNRVMFFTGANDQRLNCQVRSGGSNEYSSSFDFSAGSTNFNKIAIKYKENDFSFWVNGSKITQAATGVTPLGLNELAFDVGSSANNFFGKTKALAVWKEALSDAELADLTYPTPTDPTFALDFNTIATDFTFARGSEATYVDAQGLIKSTNELGPELVTNGSFDTDSDWLKGAGTTISGGAANLDGSLSSSFADALRQVSVFTVGKTYKVTYTISNYVSGANIIFGDGATEISANGTYTEYITATITNLGFQNGATPITCSIDNVSVKEYITATNTPRLDYSTGAEAFLLEPQSTNVITQSELFSDSSWTKQQITITQNATISPSGLIDASMISEDNTNNYHRIRKNISLSGDATLSIFAKKGTIDKFLLWSGSNGVGFDLTLGTINNVTSLTPPSSSSIKEFGNGWYRCSITDNSISAFEVFSLQDFSGFIYQGSSTNNFYIWGAQLEQQSYATSYIPTVGTTVTRNQETCINATPEINSEEGVLYAEISALADDGTNRFIIMNDSTNNNRLTFRYRASNSMSMEVHIGGVLKVSMGFNSDITLTQKIALKYKESDYAFWVNGVEVGTNTLNEVWPANTLNNIDFDGFGQPFFGNTKDLKIYTKALSDAELIKLTT